LFTKPKEVEEEEDQEDLKKRHVRFYLCLITILVTIYQGSSQHDTVED